MCTTDTVFRRKTADYAFGFNPPYEVRQFPGILLIRRETIFL
jgi:hypothetical protein